VLDVNPLRNRHEDIGTLASLFAGSLDVSSDALAELQKYSWPGNVAELRHAMSTAVVRSDGNRVSVDDLPNHVRSTAWGNRHLSLLERAEAEVIARVMARSGGNKTVAAKELGVSRPTLYAKIRTYRIAAASGSPGSA
jgi:transcriptional regulator of acetoin/glycerol metabolism